MPNDESTGNAGLTGALRLTLMVVTILVALLGTGVILDIVSVDVFGKYVKQILLIGCIAGLACGCLALLVRARV